MQRLVLRDGRTGHSGAAPAAALFLLIGATPLTGWLSRTVRRDDHGFIITGSDLLAGAHPSAP